MTKKGDRQLLELAAKAVGMDLEWFDALSDDTYDQAIHNGDLWDPLNNDGDAFRLANRLRMRTEHHISYPYVAAFAGRDFSMVRAEEPIGFDENKATRRAIVRAAAGLGNQQ